MTKKDYVKLAAVFANRKPSTGEPSVRKNPSPDWVMWNVLRFDVADVLSSDNPKFDLEKFIVATNAV